MTDTPQRGGLRTPAGGRPRKNNAILHCYIPSAVLTIIDKQRGPLTRGEYIAALVNVVAPADVAVAQDGV